MRIVAVSDLHGWLPPALPVCDLLLIAGDVCPDVAGSGMYELRDRIAPAQGAWLADVFAPWLESQPARTIAMCWGNHDYVGEVPACVPPLPAIILTDETREIAGLRIHANPWTHLSPETWAFDVPLDEIGERMARMPTDIDVLMTHGPPYGICDRTIRQDRAGSPALADAVARMRSLRLHVFGHIHEARGREGVHYNVSVLDADYRPHPQPVTEIDLS